MLVNGSKLDLNAYPGPQRLLQFSDFTLKALTRNKNADCKSQHYYLYQKDNVESRFEIGMPSSEGCKPLTSTQLISVFTKLAESNPLPKDQEDLKRIHLAKSLLKDRIKDKYYSGLLGRICWVISFIFTSLRFENSALGLQFADLEKKLQPTLDPNKDEEHQIKCLNLTSEDLIKESARPPRAVAQRPPQQDISQKLPKNIYPILVELKGINYQVVETHLKSMTEYVETLYDGQQPEIPRSETKIRRFAILYFLIKSYYKPEHLEKLKALVPPPYLAARHQEWLSNVG